MQKATACALRQNAICLVSRKASIWGFRWSGITLRNTIMIVLLVATGLCLPCIVLGGKTRRDHRPHVSPPLGRTEDLFESLCKDLRDTSHLDGPPVHRSQPRGPGRLREPHRFDHSDHLFINDPSRDVHVLRWLGNRGFVSLKGFRVQLVRCLDPLWGVRVEEVPMKEEPHGPAVVTFHQGVFHTLEALVPTWRLLTAVAHVAMTY